MCLWQWKSWSLHVSSTSSNRKYIVLIQISLDSCFANKHITKLRRFCFSILNAETRHVPKYENAFLKPYSHFSMAQLSTSDYRPRCYKSVWWLASWDDYRIHQVGLPGLFQTLLGRMSRHAAADQMHKFGNIYPRPLQSTWKVERKSRKRVRDTACATQKGEQAKPVSNAIIIARILANRTKANWMYASSKCYERSICFFFVLKSIWFF